MEKYNQTEDDNVEKDFRNVFTPNVHKIGRFTMIVALILSFLPVGYFILQGYGMPLSSYINVIVAVSSIGIGMWLTEPLAYWPVLGSAGTYIGYLSGNVGAMRFPVALSIQSAMNADINTPRGQVATIIAIVASVFSNLILLLIIILTGSWLLSILPESMISSFVFVMPALIGSMLVMRLNGKDGIVKGTKAILPYFVTAILCKVLISNVLPFLVPYGMAITVGIVILVAYIMFRYRISKGEST